SCIYYNTDCLVCISSRRRHTSSNRDWSSDVCSSDLPPTHRPTAPCWRTRSTRTSRSAPVSQQTRNKRRIEVHPMRTLTVVTAGRSEERRVGQERRTVCPRDLYDMHR